MKKHYLLNMCYDPGTVQCVFMRFFLFLRVWCLKVDCLGCSMLNYT